MRDIAIATAQFEHRDADKDYNLGRIDVLARQAVAAGAAIVSFHECCITGYTFLQTLTREQLLTLAKPVPDGPSTQQLLALSRSLGAALLAGLIEQEGETLYNCYVAVTPEGTLHKPASCTPSSVRTSFRIAIRGLRPVRRAWALLTCYDNNLVENPRIVALKGAEVIFAPHVTCGLPSAMPAEAPSIGSCGTIASTIRCRSAWNSPAPRAAAG